MNKDIAFKIFSFLTRYDQIKACYRVKTIFSPYFKEWEKIGGVYSIFTKENTPNYLANYDFQDYENIGCIQHIEDIWRVAKYYVKTLPDKKKNNGYIECDYACGKLTYITDGHLDLNEVCQIEILRKEKRKYSRWFVGFEMMFYFNTFCLSKN